MSVLSDTPQLSSPEEYLAAEEDADIRHEFLNGEVYANIWQQDRIAIIKLNSGQVYLQIGSLKPVRIWAIFHPDLAHILLGRDVLNSIASSSTGRRSGWKWAGSEAKFYRCPLFAGHRIRSCSGCA